MYHLNVDLSVECWHYDSGDLNNICLGNTQIDFEKIEWQNEKSCIQSNLINDQNMKVGFIILMFTKEESPKNSFNAKEQHYRESSHSNHSQTIQRLPHHDLRMVRKPEFPLQAPIHLNDFQSNITTKTNQTNQTHQIHQTHQTNQPNQQSNGIKKSYVLTPMPSHPLTPRTHMTVQQTELKASPINNRHSQITFKKVKQVHTRRSSSIFTKENTNTINYANQRMMPPSPIVQQKQNFIPLSPMVSHTPHSFQRIPSNSTFIRSQPISANQQFAMSSPLINNKIQPIQNMPQSHPVNHTPTRVLQSNRRNVSPFSQQRSQRIVTVASTPIIKKLP